MTKLYMTVKNLYSDETYKTGDIIKVDKSFSGEALYYLKQKSNYEDYLKFIKKYNLQELYTAKDANDYLYKKEAMLEKARQEFNPSRPSRLKSIILTTKDGADLFYKIYGFLEKSAIYEVNADGVIFRTSNLLIPCDNFDDIKAFSDYWNPPFQAKDDASTEYLISDGNVRILGRVK